MAEKKREGGLDRRTFLSHVGAAASAATGALVIPGCGVAPATAATEINAETQAVTAEAATVVPAGVSNRRLVQAFNIRVNAAAQDASAGTATNQTNGDEALYPDKCNTFTKGLPHDSYGRVDQTAYASFQTALRSGNPADFAKVIMGGTRTMNGPQGGLAYALDGADCIQFGQPQVPPAPRLASDQNATEMVEMYWGSLLRDTAFSDYAGSSLAVAAAAELGALSSYTGPRDRHGRVTPDLLFRGPFAGESLGPYVSQFLVQPTYFGALPLSQQMVSYAPNLDYGADFASWLNIQNGVDTGLSNQIDPQLRYRRNGRDLATFTHVDVLYQAYFTAFLVLAGGGAPLNPGNPYLQSRSENGFCTFGGPDMAGTLGAVAVRALDAVWYQKWFIHLRPRPEATGGLVHLIKTGQGNRTNGTLSPIVLNSQGLKESFKKYGTWLLSLAFPEGSPVHPAYPTGHGTVAGACITVLKFFFDGSSVLPNPVVPAPDGLSLVPYTGADAGQLTINGELAKLGHNVSFGHGIHAGIHWRSDTDTSMLLGEAVALSFLQDRAQTYNEKFTIHLTRFDGTIATISNR